MPLLNFHVAMQQEGFPSEFRNIFDEAATQRESLSGDSTSPPGGSRDPRFDTYVSFHGLDLNLYRRVTASCLLCIFAKVPPR